jgi:inosine-uridine nucleoside N-ribohydrolase
MKRALLVIIGILGWVAINTAAARADFPMEDTDEEVPPVIFDNDMDFDDTAALAYLARFHKAGRIDLRLVSITSAGAAFPGRGIQFARCLLERFGITDVPVVDSSRPGVNAFPSFLRVTFDQILSAMWRVKSSDHPL